MEQDAIGAYRSVDAGLVADAASVASALVAELDVRDYRAEGFRKEVVAEEIGAGAWRNEPYKDVSDGEHIDPRTLSLILDDVLPENRIVAIDSGHFMGWPAMYLSVPDAAGFVFTQSYQSIGLGLASAIGASVAHPDRLTVACLGDGGALMSAGEFETIGRLHLPMVIVVYNDAAYSAEVHHFGPGGHPVDTVRFPDTDFAALGRAFGAGAVTVRRPEDLRALEEWLADRHGPFVVDARIAPDVVAEWLQEAFRAH